MDMNCIKCKLVIDPNSESYIEMKEFKDGNYYKSVYWHKACWKEYFSGKKDHKELMGMARKMMSRFGANDEEVVIV